MVLGGVYFWVFVRDDINARTTLDMLATATCTFCMAWAMAAHVAQRDRRVYWSTAAGFVIYGAAAILKGADAVWGPQIHFWTARPVDFVFLGALNVCIVGSAFGLSLAINLQLQHETEALALFDSLTLLPNRRHFEEYLERAEKRTFRSGNRIALVYCDLDDFKAINDAFGHEGGDMALRVVAERLRGVADEGHCVARVGGDEFLLLIENAPSRDALHALIQRLREAVEGEIELAGRSAMVKISCGLAVYPDDVGSVSDLIRLGDAAMYMMKQHGRFGTVDSGQFDRVDEGQFAPGGEAAGLV
jgi:diguanylate cyclase (GGDEF)-like protein